MCLSLIIKCELHDGQEAFLVLLSAVSAAPQTEPDLLVTLSKWPPGEWIRETCLVLIFIVSVHFLQAPFPRRVLPVLVFLNLSTVRILGQTFLCYKDCSVHCRVVSNILGPNPLNVSGTALLVVMNKNVSRCCPMACGGVAGRIPPK